MGIYRDTYKYWFKVGNLKVHCGITDNLLRRESEHKNSGRYTTYNGLRYYWQNGHIVQVGNITTKEAAMEWERQNGCNKNWG
ncbi:hypothetical protein INQ51_07290 [Maribellus sp. CM-23]|uniref:hypothetical protein n=1 Tax=Maribellus sp. CM-23 TaxID=2781026 RepID=UPI001F3594E4|nr:hypothetical protein [Maribellus sp. CM-23]MCE4564111.1 hypothetical protein [Maribellus sp. CM-23]